MTDRPILFSAPMVRALLDGRKTQARRALKPIPWNKDGDAVDINIAPTARYVRGADGSFYYAFDHPKGGPLTAHRARFAIGDRLWVRETWTHTGTGVWQTSDVAQARDGEVLYRATDDRPGAGWFPSIFMFRRHSRLTLIVTDVRVQRLQDCSEADAIAEGIEPSVKTDSGQFYRNYGNERCPMMAYGSYRSLWDSINGPGAWDANPWVVAVSFSVEHRNIDRDPPAMTCTHDPVIMTERHGRELRYRAECKYCHMHALSCDTQAEAMRDWERMTRPASEWRELLVTVLPITTAIIALAVFAWTR